MFAFNIWDINSAKAVMDALAKRQCEVILQTLSSIYEMLDKRLMRSFVAYYAEKKNIKVWLHLDHCKKITVIEDAIRSGLDSVMLDASEMSID